jgi:hypothetical protein
VAKINRLSIALPESVRYEAVICALQASTTNAAASAQAAERAAYRNGIEGLKPAEFRAAVEFLRLLSTAELARIAGAPASAITGGSSVLIQTENV